MRAILIRFAIPTLLAVSILAYFGVPFVDRILAGWFRADVDMRAQLVANSMTATLSGLVEQSDQRALREYLNTITADERLLAVVVCRADGTLIYETERTPDAMTCALTLGVGERGGRYMQLKSGSVEVSAFSLEAANREPIRLLIVHDLSFIDRRQSTARNYVLALAGVIASALALLVGFLFWLLLRRWVNVLVSDIRGRRYLDDAESDIGSRPILTQIRRVLREVEHRQRLEIDFHENWTPQALQQVVRDHLHSPEMFIVSNREPYIHNASQNGPVVQVPASGMVTALEPIMRACEGMWVAHGSGTADRDVVDRHDHVRVPPDDPSYTPAPRLALSRRGARLLLRLRQRRPLAAVPPRVRSAGVSRNRLAALSGR